MKENALRIGTDPELRVHGKKEGASFQVIVLGPSGGPREDNVTGLLVRAPQSEWRKGSLIAVDAGAHLAAILHLLKRYMPMTSEAIPEQDFSQVLNDGPFAGIKFPHISAKANALYVFRELLHSVLITHPHLDHVSAIAINTPALEYGREAKAIVALPSTIDAIKGHIFNDSIWPNLSDEGHGVGFITYRRLIEGGNPRLGAGDGRGYINVCDGLATKCWSLSHGKCHRRKHSVSHQRGESFGWANGDYNFPSRRMSRISDHGYFSAVAEQQALNAGAYAPAAGAPMGPAATPGTYGRSQPPSALESDHLFEPVSSSAFFIRNDVTGQEVLIFGDIEPDSVSMAPRNHIVWEDAAGKIARGHLKAMFIECSYDDSVRDADLYGHLCPRHLIAELSFLARCVINARKQQAATISNGDSKTEEGYPQPQQMNMVQPPTPAEIKRKRKRAGAGDLASTPELEPIDFGNSPNLPGLDGGYVGSRSTSQTRRKTSHHTVERPTTPSKTRAVQFQTPGGALDGTSGQTPQIHGQIQPPPPKEKFAEPLKELSVHIIHVKDTLMDGPSPGTIILKQLRSLSAEVGLGVEFDVTDYGQTVWV